MVVSRREFLSGVGGATLAYALHISCSREQPAEVPARPRKPPKPGGHPDQPGVDHRDWLIISADGSVTAFTARTEIGQGLTTVLYNLISQALELPEERITVVLGDTDLCPSDGPTTGSAATRYVGWGFWLACHRIRQDLVLLAAERLDVAAGDLDYRQGEIVHRTDSELRAPIGMLADGRVRRMTIDPDSDPAPRPYVDRATLNVNAEAIVTGTLEFTGDLYPEDCLYSGILLPPYHKRLTRCLGADSARARAVPGVVRVVDLPGGSVAVLGTTYTAVQEGLTAVEARWKTPQRPETLDTERETREGAKLARIVEEHGAVDAAISNGEHIVRETYQTQYASQAPLETDTAIARADGERTTVWLGTQNPFLVRFKTADRLGVPESRVRIISRPAGGAFGSKAGHWVGTEAARLAETAGAPVKYVYSRRDEFQRRSRYKESVIVDLASAVTSDGWLQARSIDIFQDEGFGTEDLYRVPHVRTRLYSTRMPVRHGTMRGTSYTQTVFALESHTDTVARSIGLDPLEFRRRNVARRAFLPLLDACAEQIGYGRDELPPDQGIGFGICNHGDQQLGVIAAQVKLDRSTGEVSVRRLSGAFDIGLVVNRHTLHMGVKGAMLWGLGYALFEETRIDGHRCSTASFSDYRIPRFSDCPPIDLAFLDNERPGRPRGCGELPLPATVAAICNAVYDACGVRFHTLPLSPERVLAALAQA